MSTSYLIGIDVGTSGSKGVLTDVRGKVLAHKAVEHGIDAPRPGWYEQDAEQIWWGDLVKIARSLVADANVDVRHIAAVGVSATCPDMLPVDKDGRALRKGILYSDSRAQKQIERIVALLSVKHPSKLSATGLSTHFSGPKVLWFRENEPTLFERTFKIHTASSYLAFKLTGRHVVAYSEAGGYSPLFDSQKREWDRDVCQELGLSMDLFPETAWTTDIAGGVTREAAAATGLAEGTPVIVGLCDASAEVISVGAVAPGEASLLYGTTMGIGVAYSDEEKTRLRLSGGLGVLPGFYRMGGVMTASGALTTWFRNNFGQPEREVEAKTGINAYQLLSQAAEEIPPGSEGLIAMPYFAGERAPIHDALARGLIIGLTLSHTRRHVYRALLESIAYGLRQIVDEIEATGLEFNRIVSTAGGTKSRAWTQIVSDVLGKDQEIVLNPLGSPYGDAFLAGYGAGIFNDLTPLRTDWAPPCRKVVHNPDVTRVYDRYYEVYRQLYAKNKEAMHTLAQLSI